MAKAVLAAIVTLIASLLTMSIFTEDAEIGVLVAIVVMGMFIICFNERNK